jgi:prepilin signal peptidase PulO-like enzyme (type II secretory pathway)
VPAEHVYSVLVKQQIVIGITILVAFIGFTALFTLCAVWFKKLDEWDDFWAMFLMVIFGVLAGVSFILLCTNGIPSLLNPEYGAIKEIMEVLT